MVARSVVTLGVSTERGAVHAVALAESGERLPERVLLHRVAKTHGDTKADVAAAVHAAMDDIAAELDDELEIAGAAVAYRDAAERRAIVTELASGQWHTASLVSAKAAHLSVAGAMTWLSEFDDLVICEVVPGYQAFTLVDRYRRRVLAATSQAGGATEESLGAAVTAAWDQFEAAAVRPDAVVLIGSAANTPAVRDAVDGFGAPVLPCKIAKVAPAVGAALFAMADVGGLADSAEQSHPVRGTAAVFAAASVLAGGLVVGGLYATNSRATPTVVADTRLGSDNRAIVDSGSSASDTGSSSGSSAGVSIEPAAPPLAEPTGSIAGTGAAPEPTIVLLDPPAGTGSQSLVGSRLVQDRPEAMVPLEELGATHEAEQGLSAVLPGAGVPSGTTTKVGAPNGSLLFPGEAPPPPAFTPESYRWWDNHVRMMVTWATQQVMPA
ncbi:hypothetical protein [Nocardia goodfellowii]|uniref:DUF7159 domain-containing protein n=1 Tax=Nocardia goodfellowii TaxID=882446 RepID=A0ABS4QRE4_9NOCA|nr:hypothetical protein [Nocardia goodfellowii]MBP2194279.1 hypothetical protein [Nocardia goodfellowii]